MLNLPNAGKIRALALDLDGTLLGPGTVLSERAVTAVNNCVKRGLKIIIATGRAIEAVERFRAPLEAEGPMIYYNGAVVADMPDGMILKTILMDKNKVKICADISEETGIYCQIYLFDEKRVEKKYRFWPGKTGLKGKCIISTRVFLLNW